MCNLLNKGIICNDLLGLHDILVTHIKFLNKLFNLLVLLNCQDMKSRIRSTLKYAIYIAKSISIKVSDNIKELSTNQDCGTLTYDILPWITI